VDATARLVGLVRRWLPPSGGLVVAVSGGPDSVALARAAALARGEADGPLVLAHLDHGLRGAEGEADADFVAALASALPGAELCRGRLDVGGLARREGANLEAVARRERYRWLAEVARARGVGLVATGHTADDQAETLLHRLLRGTGLQGLRGIASRRELAPGVELVRPLLPATRRDVLAFLAALGQPYREDSSNRDLRLTRNRIRHELLPHLADRYNPAVVAALARLAAQAEEAYCDEAVAAATLLVAAERPRAGAQLVFDRAALAAAPRRVLRSALRLVWEREGWPRDAMGHAGWERLAWFVRDGSRALDLPGHIHARLRRRVLLLGRLG
jgi:tRNA(Ile)-lysidine synthase